MLFTMTFLRFLVSMGAAGLLLNLYLKPVRHPTGSPAPPVYFDDIAGPGPSQKFSSFGCPCPAQTRPGSGSLSDTRPNYHPYTWVNLGKIRFLLHGFFGFFYARVFLDTSDIRMYNEKKMASEFWIRWTWGTFWALASLLIASFRIISKKQFQFFFLDLDT